MKNTNLYALGAALALLSACSTPIVNDPPVISGMKVKQASAGSLTFGVSATVTDPEGDTLTCTVDWGDGSNPQAVPCNDLKTAVPHTYSTYGVYQITVTAKDKTHETSQTLSAGAIDNRHAPSIDLMEQRPNTDPFSANLAFRVNDPDAADTLTCTLDWGDGSGKQAFNCARASEMTKTYTYKQGGDYAVLLTVSDGSITISRTLGVKVSGVNIALPQITELAQGASQGLLGNLNFRVHSSNPGDTLTCTLNWGDNTPVQTFTCAGDTPLSREHTYANNGDYAVLLTVKNANGDVVSRTVGVKVGVQAITAPQITQLVQGSSTGLSGSVDLQVHSSNPGDTLTCTLNWGDNTAIETFTCASDTLLNKGHTYANNGDYAVLLTVRNANGDVVSRTVGVKIGVPYQPDLPPTIDLQQLPTTAYANVVVQATPTDPEGGPITCRINWGDNTPFEAVPCTSGTPLQLTHQYSNLGDYAVLFEVTDGRNQVSKTLGVKPGTPLVINGNYLVATGGSDGMIKLWNATDGTLLNQWNGCPVSIYTANSVCPAVLSLSISPDGQFIASGGAYPQLRNLAIGPNTSGNEINIWNIATGKLVNTVPTQIYGPIMAVKFSRDGKKLAAGGEGTNAYVWDTSNWITLNTLNTGTEYVSSVDFDATGNQLAVTATNSFASSTTASSATVFNLSSNASYSLQSSKFPRFSPDGSRLGVVSFGDNYCQIGPGAVTIFDHVELRDALNSGALIEKKCGPLSYISSLAFRPDGAQMASSGTDGSIWRWNANLEAPATPFGSTIYYPTSSSNYNNQINEVNYSADSLYLVSAGHPFDETYGVVWNASANSNVPEVQVLRHGSKVNTAVFSPLKNAGAGLSVAPPIVP